MTWEPWELSILRKSQLIVHSHLPNSAPVVSAVQRRSVPDLWVAG